MTSAPAIRRACVDDVDQIHTMVCELADYERAPHEVTSSPDDFRHALFGPEPRVFAHVVQAEGAHGTRLAGFALWFLNFSTWQGRHGLHLEDLYVRPEHRGVGHGRDLLSTLAAECVVQGYGRLEWRVLDWNEPALRFYQSLGAVPMDEWTVHRVTGPALTSLSALAPATCPPEQP